jgi:hypothetical protein
MTLKPTIYIDQNVLSYLEEKIIKFPKEEFQCVFSETHFKEIPNANRHKYFEVLDYYDAIMVKIQLNDKFEIIDEAIFKDHHPVEALFEDFKEAIKDNDYESIFDPLLARLAGANNYSDALKFYDPLLEDLKIKSVENPLIQQLINPLNDLMQIISESLGESLINIKNIEEQRSQLGTDKGKLLQIQDEDSITKIGEIIQTNTGIDQLSLVMNSIKEKSVYNQVIALNAWLNHLGYNADTKLNSIKKAPNIRHDAEHMANAIFCNFLMSEDRRFVNKAKSIYYFLKINTIVVQLKIEK